MSKTEIKETTANEIKVKNKTAEEFLNEKVPVYLPTDGNKLKGGLSVTVNGVTMVVPRGKQVSIPRKYAMVISDSMKQDADAQEYKDSQPNN